MVRASLYWMPDGRVIIWVQKSFNYSMVDPSQNHVILHVFVPGYYPTKIIS